MITINLSHVVKGGVGKSVWSRMMCAYMIHKKFPYLAFEANIDTPDLAGFYPEIAEKNRVFEFGRGETVDVPNKMITELIGANSNPDIPTHAVVNMPAAIATSFNEWVAHFGMFSFLAERNIQIINWYIVTGDPDSLQPLVDSIKLHGSQMPHVVIRNEKFPKSKLPFPKELDDLLAKHSIPTINLPLIHSRAQDYVLANQLPYEDAAILEDNAAGYGALDQYAVKRILQQCYNAIDSTGIFSTAPVASSK